MAKRIGYGTTLALSTSNVALSASTTATYTTIGFVKSIEGPQVDQSDVEATTLDSTGSYKEFVLGLSDPGSLSFDLVWDPDSTSVNHAYITNQFDNRNELNIRVTPAGTTSSIYAKGRVKSFSGTFPVEDVIGASVALRLSGPVRWPTTALV